MTQQDSDDALNGLIVKAELRMRRQPDYSVMEVPDGPFKQLDHLKQYHGMPQSLTGFFATQDASHRPAMLDPSA